MLFSKPKVFVYVSRPKPFVNTQLVLTASCRFLVFFYFYYDVLFVIVFIFGNVI